MHTFRFMNAGALLALAALALVLALPGEATAAKRGVVVVELLDRGEAQRICPLDARRSAAPNAPASGASAGRCVPVRGDRVVFRNVKVPRVLLRAYGALGAGPCFSTRPGPKAPCKVIRVKPNRTTRVSWRVPRQVVAQVRPGAYEVLPADLVRVSGKPAQGQTLVLRGRSAAPRVGAPLVAPVSAKAPEGVLGVVTALRRSGGQLLIQTKPAALDRVYRRLEVSLDSPVVALPGQGGATASAKHRIGAFECETRGAKPKKVHVNVDLRPLNVQFELDIGARSIFFLLSGTPEIDADASIEAKAECHLTSSSPITVPIPGTPVLVSFGPAVALKSSGGLHAKFSWRPRLVIGFLHDGINDRDFRVLNPGDTSYDFGVEGEASLFLGAKLDISAGGRVGVSGQAGPKIGVTGQETARESCVEGKAKIGVGLSAFVDVFITKWTFPIASGEFGSWDLFRNCRELEPDPGGSGGGGLTEPPPPPNYSEGGAGDRVGLDHLALCDNPLIGWPGVFTADAQTLFVGCSEPAIYSLPGNTLTPLELWPPPGTTPEITFPSSISASGRFAVSPAGEYLEFTGPYLESQTGYYMVDRHAPSIERVDVPAPGGSNECVEGGITWKRATGVSDDGRIIAFLTCARLVPGDQNEFVETYYRDRVAGTTHRMPTECATYYDDVDVSDDGRYVAYQGCTYMRPIACNGPHAFLYDRVTGTRVDASPRCGRLLDMSGDGRYVLSSGFISFGDDHGLTLFDRVTGEARPVARTNYYSVAGTISDDGRYIAYAEQSVGGSGIYRLDRVALRKTRLDVSPADVPAACGGSGYADISRDGRKVAFTTCGELLASDSDGLNSDIYVARFP